MANEIKIKRGAAASLPVGAAGEPLFTTDTYRLLIGDGAANHEVVMHELFDPNSILAAVSDNTPTALALAASRILGRKATGDIGALTGAEILAILSGQAGADFAMNTHKITGVVDPANAQDAATKAYVDSIAQGLSVLADVGNATTANITLSGEQTIDGVLTSTSRILVKDQTDPIENGVYVTAAGAWTRATDMDADAEVSHSFVFVTAGTVNSNTGWVCTNEPESVVIDTDSITFSQFSAAGHIDAGTGLVKTGNLLGVDGLLEDLDTLGACSEDGEVMVATGAGAMAWESGATARASLGLTIVTTVGDPGVDTQVVSEQGIREAIEAAIATEHDEFTELTDTPANFTDAGGKLVVVNTTPDALEFVAITAFLEGTPTEDLATKAPTSEWAFDHKAAATQVHGAGANTLLHSGSTIDGGAFE